MNHPFGERFTDTATLQKAGHHTAGKPVVGHCADRADQRVTVRREGKGAIDPVFHTHFGQHRVAGEGHFQFIRDTVDILLNQFYAVVPGSPVHIPVLVVNLVDPDQYALLVLTHIGEAFQIYRHRQFMVECSHLGNGIGQQVVVLQWGKR